MRMNYYRFGNGGHCPGHVRGTFLAALEAYAEWSGPEPEPTVEFEIGYEPRPIPISTAARMVWNCSDILPGGARYWIEATDLACIVKRWTYAAAARAMMSRIQAS